MELSGNSPNFLDLFFVQYTIGLHWSYPIVEDIIQCIIQNQGFNKCRIRETRKIVN
jgi:hypothetical protein